MNGKNRARLIERGANDSGGTYEVRDVGNECGVYVDFNPFLTGICAPETMAFPYDLESNTAISWRELGTWYEDATGGKAVRELGHEIVEGGESDADGTRQVPSRLGGNRHSRQG